MNHKDKHVVGFLVIHLLTYSVYNLGHPVTPQFINDLHAPIFMTGVLFGVMALAQFIFAPFWGQVSDVFGRRIAYIGPLVYGFSQLGFVFLSNYWLLLIFRFISGAFVVITATVNFAYISDTASNAKKTKYLGIAALLMPVGLFFGYAFGGLLGDIFNPRISFLVQSICSLILALILFVYVKSPKKENASFKQVNFNVMKENVLLLKRNQGTGLKYVLLITFCNIISYQMLMSQAAVILTNSYNKPTSYVGLFIALFNLVAGAISFVIQPFLFKSRRLNHKYLPFCSLFSIIASFIAFLIVYTNPNAMWLGLMLATMFNTIFIALVQDIIIKIDINNEKGALIGINQAVQSFGIFLGTSLAGFIVSFYLYGSIITGMILFVLTFLINKFIVSKNLNALIQTN